jgi:hypothetical protein
MVVKGATCLVAVLLGLEFLHILPSAHREEAHMEDGPSLL